jgi:hypothetical protein
MKECLVNSAFYYLLALHGQKLSQDQLMPISSASAVAFPGVP